MTFPWTHEILGLFYNTVNLLVKIAEIDFEKKLRDLQLDGIAPPMTDPTPTYSTNMHSRLVHQDRSLCLGSTAHFPGPAKPP